MGLSNVTVKMFLDKRHYYSNWIKQRYYQWFKQRRKGEQAATANRIGLLSGLIVAVVSIGFSESNAWKSLEQQSYNLLHQAKRELMGAPSWDDQVVVIAIDEASVKRVGRFPWPRSTYASLLDRLSASQPAAIAFDIFFPDATEQDASFASAIAHSANVVLAVGSDRQGNPFDITETITINATGAFLPGNARRTADDDGIIRQIQLYEDSRIPSFSVTTLQMYAESMASTAQAYSDPDEHFIRPQFAHAKITNSNRPSGKLLASLSNPLSPPFWRSLPGDLSESRSAESRSDRTSMLTFPSQPTQGNLDPHNLLSPFIPKSEKIWLNWPGEIPSAHQAIGPGTLKVYSYVDVIDGHVDATFFQNKIVLVGSTLAGVDPLLTPFHKNPPVSGVYLYAATINNLLNQSFLQRPPVWQKILLLLFLSLAGSRLLKKQGVYRRLAMIIGFPIGWSAVVLGSFMLGWWLPIVAPISTIIFGAIAAQLHERQEKQQLMALFSMNVSPGTAELIWRNKGEVLDQGELAAQKLTATVLFMDIRGFTSIVETLPSQQLLPWLNQYFETMTDCIMSHGGMVDKYIGDSIMAVFGAPVPRTEPAEIKADAIAAIQASIEMHERLQSLNDQLTKQNLPTIKFGIGIHTGPLTGGTVGNRHRLNYSLFGDTVNIAARLEAMTKTLPEATPFNLLLSADTYGYAGADFLIQPFRSTRLRGRTGYTDVYTLTGKTQPSQPQQLPTQHPVSTTLDAIAHAS